MSTKEIIRCVFNCHDRSGGSSVLTLAFTTVKKSGNKFRNTSNFQMLCCEVHLHVHYKHVSYTNIQTCLVYQYIYPKNALGVGVSFKIV